MTSISPGLYQEHWLYQTYTCLICLMLSYGLQMTGKAMCHLLIFICLPFYQRRRYSAITRLWLMFDVQYTSRDTDADRALFCFTIIDYIPDSCVLDALHWRHNEHDGVSNNQPHDCLLNSLFRRRSEKTSKLRGTGLCAGNSPETGEFPAQKAGNAQNASIWWRYCPACRTTLVATRFRVAVICPIIQVPHCIRVFFYFVWFVFINHIFQFYYELCTYCNILDIYLS